MKYHDLCGNSVKLDYPTLVSTARIAVGETLENIRRYTGQISNHEIRSVSATSLSLTAEWLLREAKRMEMAASTLEVLEGMQSREEVIWVNRPEQKGKIFASPEAIE